MKQVSFTYNDEPGTSFDLHIEEDTSGFSFKVWVNDDAVAIDSFILNKLNDDFDTICHSYVLGWCGMGQYRIGSLKGSCFTVDYGGSLIGMSFCAESGGPKPSDEQMERIQRARDGARKVLTGLAMQYNCKLVISQYEDHDDDELENLDSQWLKFIQAIEGFGLDVLI